GPMIRSDDARRVLAQIVDLVSADPVLDDAAVDRAARLAVYSRRVSAPAGRQLDAIESALRSGAGLGELAVPRRPEAEIRSFLGATGLGADSVTARLDAEPDGKPGGDGS